MDLRGAQAAAGERQQHKWGEHGARLLRASRERSRHGGDSRLRARWPLCPQSGCARFVALEPRNERSRGGRSTAGSRARFCCSAWDIGRIGWARSRIRPKRRIARGARGGGEGAAAAAFLRLRVVYCVSSSACFVIAVLSTSRSKRAFRSGPQGHSASGARASDHRGPNFRIVLFGLGTWVGLCMGWVRCMGCAWVVYPTDRVR